MSKINWSHVWFQFRKWHNKTGATWGTQRNYLRKLIETELKASKKKES